MNPKLATEIGDFICIRVAAYASCPVEQIGLDQAFAEYGLDSISAVSLCADIEDHFNVSVEPTLAWDHPTVSDLTVYLVSLIEATSTLRAQHP